MDPTSALVDLFDAESPGLKKEIAKNLRTWAFKGGFRPTIPLVMEECARRGVAFTPSHRLMCILFGCPDN